MESTKTINTRSALLFSCLAVLFIIAFSACNPKVNFASSSVVPAAQGSVKIKKDQNGNYVILLTVKNLVEANRLQPPKAVYMVWADTEYNGTKNLGQLRSSSGLFSKTLKGSLRSVSAFKPVRVFITVERDNEIMFPGYQVVLTTGYFKR